MTTNNILKWICLARIFRHIADFFSSLAICVTATATIFATIITRYMVISEKKVLVFRASIPGTYFKIVGIVALAAGFVFLYYCEGKICGRSDKLFRQLRNASLARKLGYDGILPTDAIVERSRLAAYLIALVFCASVVVGIYGSIFWHKFAEIDASIENALSWLLVASLYLGMVAIATCVVLWLYLKLCRHQMELWLGRAERGIATSRKRKHTKNPHETWLSWLWFIIKPGKMNDKMAELASIDKSKAPITPKSDA